ncbi:MAG: AAA family ATPase [Syntrophus sp. (in: bacteria)]
MSRLRNLYKYLIENRKHEVQGWHNAYTAFFVEVSSMRKLIKDGKKLSQSDDKPFLKELLYSRDNGVASRGQSVLSHNDFESFISNNDFLIALSNFILAPQQDNFKKFEEAWANQGKSNNPVLVNRVAAACTLEVSTTVDSGKFNQVFSWLAREKIIDDYPEDYDQGWFAKNQFLISAIKREFLSELKNEQTDEFYLSQFVWVLYENLANPFSLKKQVVKYGAPGTGKTYLARQQTSLLFDIWKEEFAPNSAYTHNGQIEFVQFHPSFSYEDFMEGLRPILDGNGSSQLTLQNGIFKDFCCKAGKWEIDVYKLGLSTDWDSLTIEILLPYKEKLSGAHWNHIFELHDLLKFVADAVPPFFFIIDEINRAELSRVFGELMYCLEYRGVKGRVKTQYANLNNEKTGMLFEDQGYTFFIPSNIYLIGTMNTIDRSVESFDFALRRRFRWEEVMPDTGLLEYHLSEYQKAWIKLAENLESLNEQIAREPLLGYNYRIGHAYLMNMKYPTSLTLTEVRDRIWDDSIRPLLQEYLRGTGREHELISALGKAFGV